MRQSKLFGKTLKETPQDAALISHQLLYRGGFIRESAAGRYYLLPLGWRVHEKIKKIIKEEMDKTGAQEIVTPVLHPIDLWKETNRTSSVGFELMRVTDRNETEFVLGGTAEEMLVDLVRKFQLSYRDLPFSLYQFSTKFRDELRARGGLLRLREFMMKDAYSFHEDEGDLRREYDKILQTYQDIFEKLGLNVVSIEADSGYIGGDYCHEFIVESEVGESRFLTTEDGEYAAHEDIARFKRNEKNLKDELKQMTEVRAVRGNTMQDGVKLHNLPLWQQIKNVMFINERGELILGVIRGDLDINETKLARLSGSYKLSPATEEEIRSVGSEPGFISPVGISKKIKIIGDLSLRTIKNAYTGGNQKHIDLINVNIDRDYTPDAEGDIGLAQEGYLSENDKPLVAKKGIEVGHIFELQTHYSSKMTGANFKDRDGALKPYYMGCYGMGLARTMAAVVETHNDEKGIIWPEEIAPFQVHLLELTSRAETIKREVREAAEETYEKLLAKGIEVLYDDREDKTPGEKFADSDLLGIPWRVVVSENTLKKKGLEIKKRNQAENRIISLEELLKIK